MAFAAVLAAPAVAAQAVIVVEAVPAQAIVVVDGELVGVSPVTVPVTPGAHTVSARLGRYVPATREVRVGAGDTLRVRLELAREVGRVRLQGLPDGAEVVAPDWPFDGREGEVPTGIATLRVRSPEADPLEVRFNVEPGAVTTIEYQPGRFAPRVFLANALLPGSVQLFGGRRVVGAGYLLGTGVAAAAAFTASRDASQADTDYVAALQSYEVADSEEQAVARWALVEAEYDRTQQARRRLRTSAVAGLVVYTLSFVDGVVFHSRRPRLRAGRPQAEVAWELGPTPGGLAVRYRF